MKVSETDYTSVALKHKTCFPKMRIDRKNNTIFGSTSHNFIKIPSVHVH